MVHWDLLWLQYISTNIISPLRRIPGPFVAGFTEYWLVVADLAGKRTETIHQLHRKYGPVVRVGPKEVSFADESINAIYSQQTQFMKAKQYELMSLQPLGIFSLNKKSEHAQRRALYDADG
jgi:hypothetical protein